MTIDLAMGTIYQILDQEEKWNIELSGVQGEIQNCFTALFLTTSSFFSVRFFSNWASLTCFHRIISVFSLLAGH